MTKAPNLSNLANDEPVLVTHLVGAAVAAGTAALVTHGVITGTQASSVTQTVVPLIVAAFFVVQGVVLRRWVAPGWKLLTGSALPEIPSEVTDEMDPEPDDPAHAAEQVAAGAVHPAQAAKLAGELPPHELPPH